MKIRGGYILYLLILCAVVGCKGTSSPSTVSETDKYAGTCEGEKAKAILWVDYKRALIPQHFDLTLFISS